MASARLVEELSWEASVQQEDLLSCSMLPGQFFAATSFADWLVCARAHILRLAVGKLTRERFAL